MQFDVRLPVETEQNLRRQPDGKLAAEPAQELGLLVLILNKCNKSDYYKS